MEILPMTSRVFRHGRSNLILASLLFCFSAISEASNTSSTTLNNQPTIVLGSSFIEPLSDSSMHGFLDLIAKEAFKRIGINIVIHQLPAERSIRNANTGIIDGDIARVNNINRLYPNLIRIPEKIIDFDFVAFSNSTQDDPVINWKTIQPLVIGLVRGWKIFEINTKDSISVTKVKNAESLFKLLKKGRVEIALYERFEGYSKIMELGLKNAHVLEPPLASKEMFLYVNKKHIGLVPKLTQEIRAMKKDGTFERIRKSSFSGIMPEINSTNKNPK